MLLLRVALLAAVGWALPVRRDHSDQFLLSVAQGRVHHQQMGHVQWENTDKFPNVIPNISGTHGQCAPSYQQLTRARRRHHHHRAHDAQVCL